MSYWQDKTAVVTGGSAGLGRVIAEAAAGRGMKVALAALPDPLLEAAEREMRDAGHDVLAVPTDVTDQAQVDAMVDAVLERFGRLDMLVNNAGRSMRGRVADTSPEQFRDLIELNFLATVRCTRAALPHLLETSGHVVNIGSLAAKSAGKYLGAYPASKFPVAAYSQQLRLELNERGLHVLLVCPGPIARDDAGSRYDHQSGDLPDRVRAPGAGVDVKTIDPKTLTDRLFDACRRRKPELVMPGKARLLFAVAQLFPSLGDWIVKRKMGT